METQGCGTLDHPSRGRAAGNAPSPRVERLARFLFDLQADSYDAEEGIRELAWADDGIRGFWLAQAGAVVSFLGPEAPGVTEGSGT